MSRTKIARGTRARLMAEAGNRCSVCYQQPSWRDRLELHHIVPCAYGGRSVAMNLQVLCCECHKWVTSFEYAKQRFRRIIGEFTG